MTDVPRIRAILEEEAPPAILLMRLMLAGLGTGAVMEALRALAAEDPRRAGLLALADSSREGLARLERMVASGADHLPAASAAEGVAAAREMFDRLVALSPEASVAAYSLGDPVRLQAATDEVVAWLRGQGLLDPPSRILDLGCGIGRFCSALAPLARHVVGIEVSAGMARTARTRLSDMPNASVLVGSGHNLAAFRDGAFDLILAVDVFPYLVQASTELAAGHLREAARLLSPDGRLVILNYSYRGFEADRRDLPVQARSAGLQLSLSEKRAFLQWDGAAFMLQRNKIGTEGQPSRA
jgi:SAM-dependent methyltransferase